MDEPDVSDTVLRPRHPASADPAVAASAAPLAEDVDGDTRLSVGSSRSPVDVGPAASTASPPSVAAPAAVVAPAAPPISAPTAPAAPSAHVATLPPEALARLDPSVYRVSINGADPVPLDLVTLVGRNPRAPRVLTGAAPRLVSVPSPRQEVSSTHLEVRQQGASVVVTDLRSTNGTVVTMPGSDAVRLRPGDSLVAGPGAVVDLGDGNSIEVLPIGRLTADIAGFVR